MLVTAIATAAYYHRFVIPIENVYYARWNCIPQQARFLRETYEASFFGSPDQYTEVEEAVFQYAETALATVNKCIKGVTTLGKSGPWLDQCIDKVNEKNRHVMETNIPIHTTIDTPKHERVLVNILNRLAAVSMAQVEVLVRAIKHIATERD
jgi:hypothetical protein